MKYIKHGELPLLAEKLLMRRKENVKKFASDVET
jgi:hypothetical protein